MLLSKNVIATPLSDVRPFALKLRPIGGESLMGFVTRYLSFTAVSKTIPGLAMAGIGMLRPESLPLTLTDTRQIVSLAELLNVDVQEIESRLVWLPADEIHANTTRRQFETSIRAAYREPDVRRVSPRSLMISRHHKAIWDVRPFNFDVDTLEYLLAACPVCKRDLGWRHCYGPEKCDRCVDIRGMPYVDLRDYPQPLVEIDDTEALKFVSDLIHHDADVRATARMMLPPELEDVANDQVFEAISVMAGVLAIGVDRVWRPVRRQEFAKLSPAFLALAGRAVIGGDRGMMAFREACREQTKRKDKALSFSARGLQQSPFLTDHAKKAFVALCVRHGGIVSSDTSGTGPRVRSAVTKAAVARLGVSRQRLDRLYSNSSVIIQTDKKVLSFDGVDAGYVVSTFQHAAPALDAARKLGIETIHLARLAELGYLEIVDGPALQLLSNGLYFTKNSIQSLKDKIQSAINYLPSGQGVSLVDALCEVGVALPPWADLLHLIIEGKIEPTRSGSSDDRWKSQLSVSDCNQLSDVVATIGTTNLITGPANFARLPDVMSILMTFPSVVSYLTHAGFLSASAPGKYDLQTLLNFNSAYIFGRQLRKRLGTQEATETTAS